MIAIKQAVDAPQYLEELSEWFVQEWSELDPLQGQYPDFKIPSSLVALNEDGQLVGGLAFTMPPYLKPMNSDYGLMHFWSRPNIGGNVSPQD